MVLFWVEDALVCLDPIFFDVGGAFYVGSRSFMEAGRGTGAIAGRLHEHRGGRADACPARFFRVAKGPDVAPCRSARGYLPA